MLLALLLAAAPVELSVEAAGLMAPSGNQVIGSLTDVTVTAESWASSTVFLARHQSAAIDLTAKVDLAKEGTFVSAIAKTDLTLSGTGAWLVVLRKGASVPLVGHVGEGLRIGFLKEQQALMPYATIPDQAKAVPPAEGPVEECLVTAIHARKDPAAPVWKPPSFSTTIHRGASVDGWAPAWSESTELIVHGFVRDAEVKCDVGSGGGLGLTGLGTSSGDGFLEAQAAVLPAGTRLFASETDTQPFATLKTKVEALKLKDGTWRINAFKSGKGWVRFSNIVIGKEVRVTLGPLTTHGVGSSGARHDDWPRFKR